MPTRFCKCTDKLISGCTIRNKKLQEKDVKVILEVKQCHHYIICPPESIDRFYFANCNNAVYVIYVKTEY